ncbi:TetR/AcrR family transcriptional regulator [Sphingomonas sp. G-3-2-10]|uniref:TetR/AcrR family transcriptional regulator n=1 Tax=Sphingomonas sp. G-3-2-10 TaxID=2728838 RepID=UPI00146A68FA|nr:TetR/AcrR family transcriptional regulator [Sphingomonas sp. G-3-2-10]NML07273.1 TetR/AcrR family transcriptional regulator [Sphingomonas sp. G-3-2-10]
MSSGRSAKERIVMAAMELFWAKGYNSTSVSDILSRTQLNSGSLYHAFPGKQDILVAVLEAYRDGIYPMLIDPAWDGVEDPIERIFALLAAYRAMILETECTYGCPIGSLALELHEADPVVRDLLAANFNAWVGAIERCLSDAADRLPQTLDRRALGEFVLTTMEGGVMQARTHRDVGAFDRSIAALRDHFDMLLAKAATERMPA